MSATRNLLVYFGLAEGPPEDPADPPTPSWREFAVVVVGAALVFGVHLATPGDWSFWETGAVYVGVAVAVGLALRLWAVWSNRGARSRSS